MLDNNLKGNSLWSDFQSSIGYFFFVYKIKATTIHFFNLITPNITKNQLNPLTYEEAETAVTLQGIDEWDNFLDICGDIYREASGLFHNNNGDIAGYSIHSSQYEKEDFYFGSIIIERKV